ncbi:MAG: SUMF1/EgtB/PvdO family nonheme iron enzyme [Planctomycetaceae bacterium]|nr:SUMF1/EgtB/PvdO family nonheme iron enzyme [Planctomycetaceae bacterium]
MAHLLTRLFTAAVCIALLAPIILAQADITHQTWQQNNFNTMNDAVLANHDLNLLAFPGARLARATNVSDPHYLTDGDVGSLGGNGRSQVGGNPSVIVYYLGKPRKIQEILLYSANIDTRANQDFEIRLANSGNSNRIPNFPAQPHFTSGDSIVGPDAGGFRSQIADRTGAPLFGEQLYDWIEFRIWRTWPARAGTPAKAESGANSWASFVELQVIGDPNDPELFNSEAERQAWLAAREAERFRRVLSEQVGEDVIKAIQDTESLRRAINHLSEQFPDEYDGRPFLARFEALIPRLTSARSQTAEEQARYLALAKEFADLRRDALLANPLLNFDQLLFRRAQNSGLVDNWISNAARGKGGYGNALATVNPRDPQGDARTIIENPNNSFVGDINLHWDADKMLVTALSPNRTWEIFELNIDGSGFRQITPTMGPDIDNVEGAYMPDGSFLFISTANMLGVPCIDGSSPVGNIYRLETDGKTIRQLTFEQDQNWNPVLLPNGRVKYLRWEYTDTAHYFTRLLMHMNPDGTNQIEYYGSNGYWPNSMFYTRPIPGSTTKFATIVTGHHGVARQGELHLFDVAKGRREAEGAIQQIPGFGKPVEPVIKDHLVDDSWPKFLFPAPLDENFLIVTARLTPGCQWSLYLVDTFDNLLKIREEPGYGLFEPTPIIKQDMPPVQVNRVDPTSMESTVFITDVYFGQGLPDVPKGTVKSLRVFEYNFGYRGIGSHDYIGMHSAWDARRILGEVPVYEDGSASFIIPANTPLAIQPLDEDGRAVQLMRSWMVGMPGETQSCNGCHEHQNTVTPNIRTTAMGRAPVRIEPFLEPERPFAFHREIQPVLDRYCVGCHDGEGNNAGRPNFADSSAGPYGFSGSYHALHPFVRRPGPENDYYIYRPMEYHTSTSELFIMLEKGHHGVEVDRDSMRRLHAWADLNTPYFGTWIEVAHRLNRVQLVTDVAARATELRSLYAGVELNPELEPYAHLKPLGKIEFIRPQEVQLDFSAPTVPNWPFDTATARRMQTKPNKQLKINNDLTIELAWIPSGQFVMGDDGGFLDELPRSATTIERPFWMMTTEVTNVLYQQFDPEHDSRFIDQWSKDHVHPGYPANKPHQPVIRVTWDRANDFARWLSEQTGKKFRLPTEAEWEWASRAGTATPMWYGGTEADFGKLENMADMQTRKFVVRGVNPMPVNNPPPHQAFIPRAEGVDDGNMIAEMVGMYQANPWGLFDMHGSVSEWTSSDYLPYPFVERENDPLLRKVARGGSWRDRPEWSRSGIRRAYESWQPVYNVGIRLVLEDE